MRRLLELCTCLVLVLHGTQGSHLGADGTQPGPDGGGVGSGGVVVNVSANRATLRHGGCVLKLFMDYTAFGNSDHMMPPDFNPCIEMTELDGIADIGSDDIVGKVEPGKFRSKNPELKCSLEIGGGKYWNYATFEGQISERTPLEQLNRICAMIKLKFDVVKAVVVKGTLEAFKRQVGKCGTKLNLGVLDDSNSGKWVEQLMAQVERVEPAEEVDQQTVAKCIHDAGIILPIMAPPRKKASSTGLATVFSVSIIPGGLVIENKEMECYLELDIPGIVSIDPFRSVDPCIDLSQKLTKRELPTGWNLKDRPITGDWTYDFFSPRTLNCKRGGDVFARYRGPETWSTRDNKICRAIVHKYVEVEKIMEEQRIAERRSVLDCLKAGYKSFVKCVLDNSVGRKAIQINGMSRYTDPILASLEQCFATFEARNKLFERRKKQGETVTEDEITVHQKEYRGCLSSAVKAGAVSGAQVSGMNAVICVVKELLKSKIDISNERIPVDTACLKEDRI